MQGIHLSIVGMDSMHVQLSTFEIPGSPNEDDCNVSLLVY
jgi:hypothetical protein